MHNWPRASPSETGAFFKYGQVQKAAAIPASWWRTAGSLDDPSRFKPAQVVYAQSAQRWDHMDSALTAFSQMPPPK
jgi:hypothetical protein